MKTLSAFLFALTLSAQTSLKGQIRIDRSALPGLLAKERRAQAYDSQARPLTPNQVLAKALSEVVIYLIDDRPKRWHI